ncbi:hypothetical protein [Frondihabitans sp. PAMC 28766]|uniref:hypothetical protein n=1 Tax=Frondihabitans sp. PAMC 28766 TaxID=1795630 RepID=UPI0035156EAB
MEALATELDDTHPLGLLVRFAAQTGLRAAEIAGLHIRDMNLAAGHVEVRQTLKRIAGTGPTAPRSRSAPPATCPC